MPLVLVEHVVDDLLLAVAHQVVVLAALGQVHLGAEVAAVLQVQAAHAGAGEGRREVAAHRYLVVERVLLAVADLQAQLQVARVEVGVHLQALVAEHLRHLGHRRADHVRQEAVHLVAGGEVHRLGDAPLPATGLGRQRRRQGVAARALALGFEVEGLVQAPHHQQQDQREGQRGEHHRRLQRVDAAGEQQAAGDQRGGQAPEHPQPLRPVVVGAAAAGGEGGEHHGAGVGRGDEEHEADQHGHGDQRAAAGVVLQQLVERHLRLRHGHPAEFDGAVVEHLVQGAVAEDRHPRQGEAQGDEQHAEDEFADGPPAGDARDEQADEGRPGDPPGPVEHRPAAQPVAALAIGVEVEALGRQRAQVVADVLHQGVEQVLGGPGEQHEQQQAAGQQHVDVGQQADALVHAGHRHGDGRAHHQGDQRHLHRVAVGHAEQVVEPGVELQHAEAHVRAQAEHGGDDAEAVHGVADGPVDALADQRVQRRAQRQRQVVAVGEVGQGHGHQGEHAPAVQAPVQEQQLHGLARGLGAAGCALGRLQEVRQRLGHAEEEQGDADARGEQHAGPGQVAEFRLVVVGTELDLPVAGKRGDHHEDQVQRHRQQVVPADVGGGPGLGVEQPLAGLGGKADDQGDEQQDQRCRTVEDRWVHAHGGGGGRGDGGGGNGGQNGRGSSCF